MDEFVCNFTEHKSFGQERAVLPETTDQDDFARDESESKAEVCYFIVDGNEFNTFELIPDKHELLLNKVVDREVQEEYLLTVKATEECHLHPDELERTRFDPNDDTLLQVRVRILDIDDNPPIFTK